MHARFRLQPAERIISVDLERRGFDARFFARAFVDQLHLVAATFTPARIHARQHRGPILALGAARAGVHFDISAHPVRFARQHGLDGAAMRFEVDALQRGLALADARFIALGFAKLDQRQRVVVVALQTLEIIDRTLERLALAHDFLRVLRIRPEIGVFGLRVERS